MDVDATMIISLVRSEKDTFRIKMLMESLNRFGGFLGECPVCCFETDPKLKTQERLGDLQVQVLPLTVPDALNHYLFADKVYACAHVESMVDATIKTLIWMDPSLLVIQPPLLYDLDPPYEAAFRPVHIQNIGLAREDDINPFWEKIYQAVGVRDISFTLETFVEEKVLRAYFNTHAFAVNPARGLMQKWYQCFEELVNDHVFQADCCSDQTHQVFLHQAVLSTVLAKYLALDDIRILPPDYNYPYNLQSQIPEKKRARALNDLISVVTEDRLLKPGEEADIDIHEPLNSWLITVTTP